MSLLASLTSAIEDRPEVVTVAGRALGRSELISAAGAVAARIGGAPAVAVDATATLETVVGIVGAIMAGVPVVPVAPDAGPTERAHLLADSGATLCLTGAGRVGDALAELEGVELIEVHTDERRSPTWASAADPTLILYTSGTTGPPKGVPISAAAIAADLDTLAEAWAWTPQDRLVHGLPLFHVHGLVLGLLGALRIGSPVVHTGRPTPESYAAAGGTLYFGVPTVWSRLADNDAAAAALGSARLLVSGSAALPGAVFERLRQQSGLAPVERYGMTETLITTSTRADGERRAGWVGPALPGVETRLVDEHGGPAANDGETIGELQVRGPTVMAGYLNCADADPEVFGEKGWFRTGDVACIDESGFHRIVGRQSTDLIKSGGYRIGAGEVEAALLAHPGVQEAAVVGAPDDDLGQVVVAYVVAEGVDGTALCDFVARTLSVHKRPRRVVLVDGLPRNAMGKVQKTRLLPES